MKHCDNVSPAGRHCMEVEGEGWHLRGWHVAGWVFDVDAYVPQYRWRVEASVDMRGGHE